MIEGAKGYSAGDSIKRWIPSVVLLPLIVYMLTTIGQYSYLDYFSLIIHEAGHFFFGWGFKFLEVLGGTLMQVIIPVLLIIFFYVNYKRILLQLTLFLLGQNFLNISVYASDAQEQKLPLLGGKHVIHDWNYMLGQLGWLEHAGDVGLFFIVLACFAFLAALLGPFLVND